MPTRSSRLHRLRAALVVVGFVLFWNSTAAPQQDSSQLQQRKAGSLQQRKAKLEVQKLELEARKLELETKKLDDMFGFWGPPALTAIVGLFAVCASVLMARRSARAAEQAAHRQAFATLKAARRNQKADLDRTTHEKRLETYPELVAATAPLAIYFPDLASPISANMKSLDPHKCGAVGRAISRWYFHSGLLLSDEALDAYFRLARALTLASCAENLYVPLFPDDAKEISTENVDRYRDRFGIKEPDDETLKDWEFGAPLRAPVGDRKLELADYKFKDYVFLQTLSSRLRTTLSEDISSRRRPASKPSSRRLSSAKATAPT